MADKSKKGMVFAPFTFEVEKGKIAEFAMAVSQAESKAQVKPIYVDANAAKAAGYGDIVPPPTFQTAFSNWSGEGIISKLEELNIDIGRMLHGEEEYEYFALIHPGDVITGITRVADVYEKEKRGRPGKLMEFTVFETELKNQRGELVIRSRSILVER